MTVKGFFMIEFLIYLCIFSCISLFLMNFVVIITNGMKKERTELQRTLSFLTGLDLVIHELTTVKADKSSWIVAEPHCLIWHSLAQNNDRGICIIDNKLVCIQGHYKLHEKQWGTKVTNIIAHNIKSFVFEYCWEKDKNYEQLKEITCHLTGSLLKNDYKAHRTIVLENRYL